MWSGTSTLGWDSPFPPKQSLDGVPVNFEVGLGAPARPYYFWITVWPSGVAAVLKPITW